MAKLQEPLSPELALVDPELAARARRALPEITPVDELIASAVTRVDPPARRLSMARLVRGATLAVLVSSLALNVNLLSERRAEVSGQTAKPNVVSGVAAAAVRRAKPRRPQVRPPASAPPPVAGSSLRWPQVAAAAKYDIVIWRRHRRVLDVWTTRSRLELADLSCADARKLTAGRRYLWFVYPVLRRGHGHRFGPLLKWGVVQPRRQAAGCR